jgi:hypothetical protein
MFHVPLLQEMGILLHRIPPLLICHQTLIVCEHVSGIRVWNEKPKSFLALKVCQLKILSWVPCLL